MTKRQGKTGTIDVKAVLAEDEEFLRALVRTALQEVLEAEMTEALGAEKGERASGRQGYRSGYYGRTLITRVGKLELRVPQDRAGRFSTELFERYQRSERALVAGAGGNVRAGSVDAEGKGGLGAVPRLGGLYLARRDQGRHRAGQLSRLRLRDPLANHLGQKQLCDRPRPLPLQARAVLVRGAQG